MLYMLNVCCTQFGVFLSLYSSVHLHQKCEICSWHNGEKGEMEAESGGSTTVQSTKLI